MSEVNMVEVDDRALTAFLVEHNVRQIKHVTTYRHVRKATRTQASTVITRHDPSIIAKDIKPLSAW